MCTQALQSQHERVETQQAVSTLRMMYLGPLITSHVPQVAKALKCQLLAKLSDVMPADRQAERMGLQQAGRGACATRR